MRFSCKSCGATFQTAPGASPKVAFACPACGGVMVMSADVVELHQDRVPTRRYDLDELRARLEMEREESARARGGPRSAEQVWFAAVQGRQVGPLTSAGLQGLRARGQLSAATLVWREGWPAWVAAEAVAELRPVLGLPEEKPDRPFPVLPAAPAPPPLQATYPAARAGGADPTDPAAALPQGPGEAAAEIPTGSTARAGPAGGGDRLQPGPGETTSPGRPSALPPAPAAAETAAPAASQPPSLRSDTVPDAVVPSFADAPQAAPSPAQPPALPQAGVDPAALAAALVSASPAVAADAGAVEVAARAGGSAAGAAPASAPPAGVAEEGAGRPPAGAAAAIAPTPAAAPEPVPVAATETPAPAAVPGSEATAAPRPAPVPPAAGSRRRSRSKPPRPEAAAAEGGVKVLDLSGVGLSGVGADQEARVPRPQAERQWFAGSDEGRDFDPRRVVLAIALVVALIALALLVKAR